MGVKAILSVMLKSKGFGELFLYSINHKNSLVSVNKLKSKNLDSLKHIMHVSTVEKLMGKSSEEQEAWNAYIGVYKNVCNSIDKLKRYCSKMEKQTETKLKNSIGKYNLQKEKLKKQIEFLTNMQPANVNYIGEVAEKNINAINKAAETFNKVRSRSSCKDLLKKSKCEETVMNYTSFRPIEKGKYDGGSPDATHFVEFLKMQKQNRNEEFQNMNCYIDELVKQEKKKDILECQVKIASVAENLANFVVADVNAINKVLKENGWKDDSDKTIFNHLVTSLAINLNDNKNNEILVSNSEIFRNLVSTKLASKQKFNKSDFKNVNISKENLEHINNFCNLWNKFEKEIAELDSVQKGENTKNKESINKKIDDWKTLKNAYEKYIEEIEKCCKLYQKDFLRNDKPVERGVKVKNKKVDFRDMDALKPFLGKDTMMDKQLVEFNKNVSKIDAEIAKYQANYNSASECADKIKKEIGMYVNEYIDKFNDKKSCIKVQINSNEQGKLTLNGWKPPQDSLSLAQCVITVYYYIDKYKNNNFNIFGSGENYIKSYIEESNKLKLGFTPAE